METFEDYIFVKDTKWFVWGAAALFIGALIFHAGVVVGSRNRLSLDRTPGIMMGGFQARIPFAGITGVALPQGFIPGGHGALGTISTIALPHLTLTSRDGMTLYVEVSSTTQVSGAPGTTLSTLKVGDTILVVGDPAEMSEEGDIDARLIRVLPN